ncbi:23S ribosomal RNA methyltransferase Erm [Paenibacillaceae bacterium]|nr:23S ribosomal RNA methyltransferase Erm [Paenibacillaceae bacterium]
MYIQNKRHRKVRKALAGPNFSGQHLLHNPKTIAELIRTVPLKAEDLVLDIGAGKGALTFPLAEQFGKVIAVEHDRQFVELLRTKTEKVSQVTIVEADFRYLNLPSRSFWVVANIPFSITTATLEKLLGDEGKWFQGGALIMEKGAAQRFTADCTIDPRLLTWRMNFRMELKKVVPRTHFAPPPRVDGAIVSLIRRKLPLLQPGQHRRFYVFAAYALRERKLSVKEACRGIFTAPQLTKTLAKARANRDQAVASLTEEQWAILFQAMLQHVPAYRWP